MPRAQAAFAAVGVPFNSEVRRMIDRWIVAIAV